MSEPQKTIRKVLGITEEVLNAILFILIGLQLVIISFKFNLLLIGL